MYKRQLACFWTVEQVDLSKDYHDFTERLNENERRFVERVLAFFSWGDALVTENLMSTFFLEIHIPEARLFYAAQALIEAVHQEMYALQLQTVVRNEARRRELFDFTRQHDTSKAKADFMLTYMNPALPLADRLVAYAVVEGVMFSSAFAAIYYLKVKNVCHGVTFANEEIAKDEALHTQFAVLLRGKVAPSTSDSTRAIVIKGVNLEVNFMRNALDVTLLGLSANQMEEYVKCVGDHLLVSLGEQPEWGAKNPFPWMDMISMQGQTNFFERRVSEYHKSGSMCTPEERTFQLNTEF
jgi:ribonucleotide reductase beta subunit family protein with ferritin-like domain